MNTRPYMTAASAARELGYTISNYITDRCRRGKIPGAYQDGGIWLVPAAWVDAKKEQDAKHGIERGIKPGGHVTTGSGLKRKRQAYAYTPTGRPPGRPKKQAHVELPSPIASPSINASEKEEDDLLLGQFGKGGLAQAIMGAPRTEEMMMQEAIDRLEDDLGRSLTDAEIREYKRVKGTATPSRSAGSSIGKLGKKR